MVIFKSIVKFISAHKILYSIFVVCLTASCLSSLYVYAVFNSSSHKNIYSNKEFRTITIDLIDDNNINGIDNLAKHFVAEFETNNIYIYNNNQMVKAAYLSGNSKVTFGRGFNENDQYAIKDEIIVNDILQQHEVGNYIVIDEIEYKIIGINLVNDIYNEITYNSFLNRYNITYITIELRDIPTDEQIKIIEQRIKELYPESTIAEPSKVNFLDYYADSTDYIIAVCIIVLSIINISYLYSYMLEDRKYQIYIYRLCGISNERLIQSLTSEIMFLSSLVYVISSIITYYVNTKLDYAMTIKEYIIFFIIYEFIIWTIFSSVTRKYIYNSANGMVE